MNRLSNRLFRRLTALLLAGTCLAAVMPAHAQQTSEEEQIILPEPAVEEAYMLLGDASAAEDMEVTLYLAAEGSTTLSSVTRSIHLEKGKTVVESVLEELADPRVSPLTSSGTAEMLLLGCEESRGIVTLNLAAASYAQLSDQARLLRGIAIANTLLGLDGVEAVNLLYGDRSDAVAALPVGAFTSQYEGSTALYAQFQSEQESFLTSGSDAITRNAVLYLPTSDGYFLPELKSLTFHGSNYAAALLEVLKESPEEELDCLCPIPLSEDKLYDTPTLRVTDAGERVVVLNISSVLLNYLAFSGMEPWQLYGSITLTLCSFMPELDGVQLWVDGVQVTDCTIGDRQTRFSDGIARRSDFSASIGGSAGMYFTDDQGSLRRVERAMSQADALSPLGVLRAMVASPAPDGMHSVFPDDLYGEDILGVYVKDGVASVNLSGSFYTRCQSLNESEERCLIYAMINALCELSGIGAVRFLVEGTALESLSQSIYLKTALLPDPGLVVHEETPAAAE